MDTETWTRLSKVHRSLSEDERCQLKAFAHGDSIGISAAALPKFLELNLVQADAGKTVITCDGQRIAQWS